MCLPFNCHPIGYSISVFLLQLDFVMQPNILKSWCTFLLSFYKCGIRTVPNPLFSFIEKIVVWPQETNKSCIKLVLHRVRFKFFFTGMTSASRAAFQQCPDHIITAGWLRQWEWSFLPKETTVAESPDRVSNLEPYDYQADVLTVCYCLPVPTK